MTHLASRDAHVAKVHAAVRDIVQKYHLAPLDEGIAGKAMHTNAVLATLTYLLGTNHLLIGEPGWGKTTLAKIVAARMSGLPYDLYDSLEIRGHPQKYEEKVVARPHFGALNQGKESVVWQGTFGLAAIIVDEVNRLPPDTQDVLLQGIDTGRWIYLNHALFAGKKPTFMTMNPKDGDRENGLLPALKDRIDIVTEEQFFGTWATSQFEVARARVQAELHDDAFTTSVFAALSRSYDDFKTAVSSPSGRIVGHLTSDERTAVRDSILSLGFDNDAHLFLMAFMAELNYSARYGTKRAADPISDNTHDQNFAGVHVKHSFSPRSAMSAMNYARGIAWFLGSSEVGLDHMRFVLPHVIAHKVEFTDDYRHAHGHDDRKDAEPIHLARKLVEEVFGRYVGAIQPMKNVVAYMTGASTDARTLDSDPLGSAIVKLKSGVPMAGLNASETTALSPDSHDHPLMKELVRNVVEETTGAQAFYEAD